MTDGPDRRLSSPTPAPGVTDEDRNRYGILLDRAAERGLLAPDDYQVRLRDLAAASTVEQMKAIVTELPAFTSVPGPRSGAGFGTLASPRGAGGPGGASGRRSRPWLLLVIVVAVVAASLLFLSLYAGHLVRSRNSGLGPPPPPATRPVSALRP